MESGAEALGSVEAAPSAQLESRGLMCSLCRRVFSPQCASSRVFLPCPGMEAQMNNA